MGGMEETGGRYKSFAKELKARRWDEDAGEVVGKCRFESTKING